MQVQSRYLQNTSILSVSNMQSQNLSNERKDNNISLRAMPQEDAIRVNNLNQPSFKGVVTDCCGPINKESINNVLKELKKSKVSINGMSMEKFIEEHRIYLKVNGFVEAFVTKIEKIESNSPFSKWLDSGKPFATWLRNNIFPEVAVLSNLSGKSEPISLCDKATNKLVFDVKTFEEAIIKAFHDLSSKIEANQS